MLWTIRSGSTMAGGRLFRAAVTAPAMAARLGWSPGLGRLGLNPTGVSLRPVSMMWWPSEWSFDLCVSDRTTHHLSEHAASFGRCSVMRRPGVRVAVVPNSPRMASGASGFGSKLSCCASPPERKM